MKQDMPALRALGLTEYGARAYAALVDLGASPAADVAQAAPVPRTKVYAVLAELARRKWIEVEPGRPRRYRALPPRECFDRESARIAETVGGALPSLEARYSDRSRRFGGALWMLDGADLVTARGLEMVEHARAEVLLIASFALPGDDKALLRALRAAARRGVRVRVGVPRVEGAWSALAQVASDARLVALPPRLLAVDGRQAMMCFQAPGPRVQGVWHSSPELLSLMMGMIAHVFESAPEV